jgi:hypothetical protein
MLRPTKSNETLAVSQNHEGTITEMSYMVACTGDPKLVKKVSFVTQVGALYCGIGYYKCSRRQCIVAPGAERLKTAWPAPPATAD